MSGPGLAAFAGWNGGIVVMAGLAVVRAARAHTAHV